MELEWRQGKWKGIERGEGGNGRKRGNPKGEKERKKGDGERESSKHTHLKSWEKVGHKNGLFCLSIGFQNHIWRECLHLIVVRISFCLHPFPTFLFLPSLLRSPFPYLPSNT
jgi:hypothetical protein